MLKILTIQVFVGVLSQLCLVAGFEGRRARGCGFAQAPCLQHTEGSRNLHHPGGEDPWCRPQGNFLCYINPYTSSCHNDNE